MGGCRHSGCCRTDSELGRVGIVIGLIPAFNRLYRVIHGGLDESDIQQGWWTGTTHWNRRRGSGIAESDVQERNLVPVGDDIGLGRWYPAKTDEHDEPCETLQFPHDRSSSF